MPASNYVSRVRAFAALWASSACALAQSFNVDVGAPTLGAPSSSYGAAANSPGAWNAFSASNVGGMPLVDLLGSPTGVTLSITGGQGNFHFNNALTTGDDQALLDDTGDLNLVGGGLDSATYTFNGLANGRYRVFVYAWTPDVPSFTTCVDIAGGVPCCQPCGGANWSGGHVEGETYVQDAVQVSSNSLTLTVTSILGWGSCNGIQLVSSSAGLGAQLGSFQLNPSPFMMATDIETNPMRIVTAWGQVWVTGNGSGTAQAHRYKVKTSGANQVTAEFKQSYDVSEEGVQEPNSLIANTGRNANNTIIFRRLVVSDTGVTDAVARHNWDSTAGTLEWRDNQLSTMKYYAASDVDTASTSANDVWTLDGGGIVGKWSLAMDGSLTGLASWSLPSALDVVDLAHDYVNNVLWAMSRTSPCGGLTNLVEFVPLHPDTGAILGPSFRGNMSLPAPNTALSCDIAVSPADPTRLAIIALHETGANDTVVYYALDSFVGAGPVNYCTAGTSAIGCVPLLSMTGNPSWYGLTDGILNASPLEGQKTGLCFYGLQPTAISWGLGSSSFLCVKSPTQRLPAQNSGGNPGVCNGAYSFDLLQHAYANPSALGQPFVAGTNVYAQVWYRDPASPKSTSLTDAVMITWQP